MLWCTAARDAAAAQQEAQAAQQAAQQAEEEARRAEALRRQEQAQAQRSEAEKAREEEAAQRRAREQAYRAQEAARIAEDKARLEAQAQAQKAKEEAQRAKEAAQKAEAARKADAIQAKRRTRASSLVYSIGSLLDGLRRIQRHFLFHCDHGTGCARLAGNGAHHSASPGSERHGLGLGAFAEHRRHGCASAPLRGPSCPPAGKTGLRGHGGAADRRCRPSGLCGMGELFPDFWADCAGTFADHLFTVQPVLLPLLDESNQQCSGRVVWLRSGGAVRQAGFP